MWDEVVLDYEDETVAFGPRKVLGAPGKFDIKTLATISTAHTVKPAPDVFCMVSADFIVLAADVQLSVFTHDCSEFLFALTFDNPFEAAALGPGGVLVLGEVDTGKLHLVSLPLRQLLVSMPLLGKDESFIKIWISPENSSGQAHLVIQTSGQNVHVFTPLDPSAINQALKSGSQELLLEFQRSLCHTTFSADHIGELSTLLKDAHSATVLWIRQVELELMLPLLFPETVSRVAHSLSQKYTLVQDSQGCLHVLCSTTLMPLYCWESLRVQDFMLSSPSLDSEKLVLLVTGATERELQVWSFPGLEQQFRVVLGPWCTLAQAEPGVETMLLLEGSAELSKMVDRLLLREVKEEVPENRLNLLLRKRKFEEAVILAKLHHLDTEEIHKSRLSVLLSSIANDPTNESHFFDLRSCLSYISDSTFVFNACMQHSWPSEGICRKILRLIQQHLQDSDASEELLSQVGRTLFRLDTFILMPRNLYDWSHWGEFAHSTALRLFCKLLEASHTQAAFLLWERHRAEFLLSHQETVREILALVPDSLSVDLLVFWLRTSLLPGLLQRCPLAYDDVAAWLKERVFALEATDKRNWPENGLKLTSVILEQPSNEDTTQLARLNYHLVQQMMGKPASALSQLADLHRTLEQLKVLWITHRCPIPLSHFLQPDKREVAHHLLRLVPEYSLAGLVTSFLNTFLGRCGLDQGSVLLSHILQEVRASPQSWRGKEEPVWHSKVLKLVECILNLDKRLAAVVAIASQSPLPWNTAVSSLVDLTLGQLRHHPQQSLLEHEKKVLVLKQVLLKYDIRNFKMDDKVGAYDLLHLILHQEGSTLEEGLEVSKVFPHIPPVKVYFFRSLQLLKNGKLDDFRDVLATLPPDVVSELTEELTLHLCFTLQDCQQSLLEGAVCAGNLVESKSSTLILLEQALALWKEFGLRPSLEQLQDRDWCLKELEQRIESALRRGGLEGIPQGLDDKKSNKASNLYFKLHRLGQLLGLKLEVRGIVANCAARLGRDKEALALFREMAAASRSISEMMAILRHFCQQLNPGTSPEVLALLCDLGCAALNVAPPKLLKELVFLCTWLSDLAFLMHHTAPDYSTDDYTVWKLSPLFSDKGFPLPPESLFKAYLNTFPLPSTTEELSSPTEESTPRLVQLLKENAHDLKAFCIGVRSCLLKKAPFIKDLVATLVFNLTNKSSPDFPLGLGLVAAIPFDLSTTFNTLRLMVGRDSKNALHITAICIAYAAHSRMPQVVLQLRSLYLQAYWSSKLAELQVPPLSKINHSESFSSQLVKRVVAARDLALLQQLAESLGLDLKDLLPQFLEAAVQAPPEKLKSLKDVLALNPDPSFILELLHRAVSPYNYEAISLLLDHLSCSRDRLPVSRFLSKGSALIKLLIGYTRCSPPSDYEKELWEQFPTPMAEELSATRLPLHPFFLGKPSKIYNQELFPETQQAWMAIGSLLEMNRDDLLMITVSNTLGRWLGAYTQLHVEDDHLMDVLAQLFQAISSPEKATVCATEVLQRLPASVSYMRCLVAKGAIKLATWWREKLDAQSSGRNPTMALQELTKQYRELATTYLLHRHGMDALYQPSSMTPQELVLALLQDPGVDSQLVKQVVDIHNLDLAALCIDAVETWLDGVAPPEYNANETFNLTALTKMAPPINLEQEESKDWNLNEMVRLLSHEEVQKSLCLRLVNSSLSFSSSTYKKSQILRALFSVRDDVAQLSGRADLWDRLVALTCLSDLEALHLPVSLEAVLQCPTKLHLVTMLLNSRGSDPLALRLALSLCLDEGIWAPQLWAQLLERMLATNMMPQLEKTLPLLNDHPPIWQMPVVVKAWRNLLWDAFRQHDLQALTPQVLIKIFGNLLRSPCRDQLDLEDLARLFQSAGSPLLAWGCRLLSARIPDPPQVSSELPRLLEADPASAIFLSPVLGQLPSSSEGN